jgi:hypothetical protein
MVRIGMDTKIGRRGYLSWAVAWPRVLTEAGGHKSEILDLPVGQICTLPVCARARSARKSLHTSLAQPPGDDVGEGFFLIW